MRPLALMLPFLLAAACAPAGTSHRLEPPAAASPEARRCLADCAAARNACLLPADEALARCEERAVLRHALCEDQARNAFWICRRGAARDGQTCHRRRCRLTVCPRTALEACATAYRRCFATCGGQVVEEQP